MVRLRVPASPVKARQATSAYAAVSNQTKDRSSYDPRSTDSIRLDHDKDALETSLPARQSIQPPIKGTVKTLASISRATKSDIQGYIVGQYKAIEKLSHERVDRTGTRTVFFLGGEETEEEEVEHLDEVMKADLGAYVNEEKDEDRPWNGVREFIRKDASLKTGASAKTRVPSLAQCIASAGVDDAESDLDSDSEDDKIDLSKKIEHVILSFASKIEEYQDDQEDTTPAPPTNNYAVRRSSLLSSLEAIDIPYPHKPKQSFGIRRHNDARSLEFLITCASDVSSSPDDDDRSPSRSRSASPSPPSSPFPSPNAGNLELSANNALAILRERFRIVHYTGGGTSCYCREWLNAKFETGCSTVHGPSLLRFATNCYEHEELHLTKNANVITHPDQHDVLFRVRTSPSKDTLNTKSSVRTSVFSKCTSITSMSSYQTRRPQSVHNEQYPLIDVLGSDIGKHQCDTAQDQTRIGTLPMFTTKKWFSELQVEEIEQPCVPLQMSAEDPGEMSPMAVADETYNFSLVREETVESYDDVSTGSDDDSESEPVFFDTAKGLRRHWTSRMKHCIQELPGKTKQATRDCVKATKQFSRTAWNFVPATFSRRHPFQKISNII